MFCYLKKISKLGDLKYFTKNAKKTKKQYEKTHFHKLNPFHDPDHFRITFKIFFILKTIPLVNGNLL